MGSGGSCWHGERCSQESPSPFPPSGPPTAAGGGGENSLFLFKSHSNSEPWQASSCGIPAALGVSPMVCPLLCSGPQGNAQRVSRRIFRGSPALAPPPAGHLPLSLAFEVSGGSFLLIRAQLHVLFLNFTFTPQAAHSQPHEGWGRMEYDALERVHRTPDLAG